jgi:uncharacterized protein (TIGR02996 family)
MTDRADLLAAVCDRPDDDTPRLVFADWCDDHGDPDYARFIRAQVNLAGVPEWDRRRVRTWHRDRDLVTGLPYRGHYPLPPAGPGERPPQHREWFRRGFPWDAEYPTPARFVDRAAELFALAPFQSVTVSSEYRHPPPDVSPLAADRQMTRLRRLAFSLSRLGADHIRRLADSPHLRGVTELSFEFDAITPDGMAELLRADFPGRLTRLHFRRNDPVWARALGDYDGASTLRALALSDGVLAGAGLTETLSGSLFRGLVELDLSGNRLGPAGVTALAASPAVATLESLTLCQTAPGVPGVQALVGSPALGNLCRLSLRSCDLGPVAVKAIAQSPHLRNLTVLDLAGNVIGDKGALALAASPYLRNLAYLDLTECGLTDRGAAALLDSPVTVSMEWLRLSGNLSVETFSRLRERFG